MDTPVRWHEFIRAFDYTTTHKKTNSILFWDSWEKDSCGVNFQCKTALGNRVSVRLDLVAPEIVRFRMNTGEIKDGPREMLLEIQQGECEFSCTEENDCLIIQTSRLRVEFPRQPWGMRIFDLEEPQQVEPFFQQQIADRAYGPGYEVPPIGYLELEDGGIEVREAIAVQPGEAFYGFGERFTALDKWNQEFNSWAVDSGNVSSLRAYKNIPFYISSAGYGIFINSSFPMVFRMGSESNSSYTFHIYDSQLDYFIIRGPAYTQILKRYADLTGYAPLPPKWSFGFWISRCLYMSREEAEGVINGMRDRGYPCDVISLDPYWMGESPWCTYRFDEEIWPDPTEMMSSFKERGIRTCLWITSYLPENTPYYQEAAEKGYLIKAPDGSPAPVLEAFTGVNLAAVDFTNPEAAAWWQDILRGLLDMGASTFKTDFAEQAPIDAIYHDGRSGTEMHNIYPLIYNKTAFELTEDYFGKGLVWGRSAYASSQRYPVQWGGDSYASFPQVVGQLRALLGYGLSGVPFCSHDVGGFDYQPEAFDTNSLEEYPLDSELYLRWLQFGVFSSHLRAHGKQPREPWEYGDQAAEIAMEYLQLRYRLLPYIYSQAVISTKTGLPMVRPLLLAFQDDPNTRNIDLQYLFGSDFLVAPILNRNPSRKVYLPEGDWFDYWSKECLSGSRWIEVDAPLAKLPLFVRAGAVIPYGPVMDYVDQIPLDPLELEFYGVSGSDQQLIREEAGPDIEVNCALDNQVLRLEISNAPSQVQVRIFGFEVDQLVINAEEISLSKIQGGWQGGS